MTGRLRKPTSTTTSTSTTSTTTSTRPPPKEPIIDVRVQYKAPSPTTPFPFIITQDSNWQWHTTRPTPPSPTSRYDIVRISKCQVPIVGNGRFHAETLAGTWLELQGRDSVLPGTHVTLTCDSGLAPNEGASQSVCLLNGNWSEWFGRCFLPTTRNNNLTLPFFLRKTSHSFSPALLATTLSLPRAVSEQSETEQRIEHSVKNVSYYQLFSCVALFVYFYIQCLVPVVLNGALTTNDTNIVDVYTVRPGSLLSLKCNSGYFVARGTNESVCLTNGEWWKPLGVCSRRAMPLYQWIT